MRKLLGQDDCLIQLVKYYLDLFQNRLCLSHLSSHRVGGEASLRAYVRERAIIGRVVTSESCSFCELLDERMKTLKTALVVVAVFAAMNATLMKADQPRMQRAIELLRQARAEIQAASPTKGGHRTTAVEHINRAIDQLEKGMTYDRNH